MTTKLLAKVGPDLVASAVQLPRKRGRRPSWMLECGIVPVPHPYDERRSRGFPMAQVMGWTGRSRQTVMRWVEAGGIPDAGLKRLCQLYGYGLVPIPPEQANHPCAKLWAQFRFIIDTTRPLPKHLKGHQLVLVTPSGQTANAVQIWALYEAYTRWARLMRERQEWEKRARLAEAEAARLQDAIANQV